MCVVSESGTETSVCGCVWLGGWVSVHVVRGNSYSIFSPPSPSLLLGTPTALQTIDSASPFGIAVFDEHIYWTDMNLRTVNRARKDSGTAVSVVWEGGSDDQLAEIRVIKKTDLWNKGWWCGMS